MDVIPADHDCGQAQTSKKAGNMESAGLPCFSTVKQIAK